VYLEQDLRFRHPVYVGDRALGRITVEKIRKLRRSSRTMPSSSENGGSFRRGGIVLTCDTRVLLLSPTPDGGLSEQECVRGRAKVWVVDGVVAGEDDQASERP